jgi:hypothetical protein
VGAELLCYFYGSKGNALFIFCLVVCGPCGGMQHVFSEVRTQKTDQGSDVSFSQKIIEPYY